MQKPNVYLIGPRAAGKSKTGKRLHKFLGYQLLSTDTLICYESGLTIPEYVEKEGWAAFRDLEYQVLQKASRTKNALIDCGGGILIDLDEQGNEIYSERKANIIKEGFVIFLNANHDYIIAKVESDPARPSLSDRVSFANLLKRREPYYKKAAKLQINTTGRRGKDVAVLALPHLEKAGFDIVRQYRSDPRALSLPF